MRFVLPSLVLLAAIGLPSAAEPPKPEKFDDTGFETVFDGKTLKGWTISAKTGHSNASKNKSGGKWEIQDGAITGTQDIPGNGGIAQGTVTNAFAQPQQFYQIHQLP